MAESIILVVTVLAFTAIVLFWLGDKYDKIIERLGAHDTADELLAQRVDGLETRVTGLDTRVGRLEVKMDEANSKLDTLIGRQSALN